MEYVKATVLIIVIIVGAYYVTKFVATRGFVGVGRSNPDIKLRSSLPLGKDKQLVIAEIGEQAYILGVTSQHVELVDKLDRAVLDEQLRRDPEEDKQVGINFRQEFLERLRGTYKGP